MCEERSPATQYWLDNSLVHVITYAYLTVMTNLLGYLFEEESELSSSGGFMVARLKLKGIDGRLQQGVDFAA